MTQRVKKADMESIVSFFKLRFINFEQQKIDSPTHVVNDYISWLYTEWDRGLISLQEYRKLLSIDILK
jgi:hypothetical protein